jgi:hypothetical protein
MLHVHQNGIGVCGVFFIWDSWDKSNSGSWYFKKK